VALYQIPDPKENNVWYSYTGSDTVIIFLHGIFSDSRGCWLYEAPSKRAKSTSLLQPVPAANTVYWPELVRTDPAFKGVDIFLAGFYTSIESHDYDLVQCALEVYEALNMARAPAAEAVMAKDNLIFLGHSTGGIVARYVL